jgi:hypothetical protein
MSGMRGWRVPIALAAVALAGCGDRGATSAPSATLRIVSTAVSPNPFNTLSATVSYTATGADSARLVYWSDTEPPRATPYSRPGEGPGRIVALGLAPQTAYHGSLEVRGAGGAVATTGVAFSSGDLPAALQFVHLQLVGTPPPGYLLTGVTAGADGDTSAYAVAFDPAGQIRWYRGFHADPGEHALACEQQSDGHFTLFVGASPGWLPVAGRYYEFTAEGESLAVYTAGAGLYTDPHELLLRDDGPTGRETLLFGYDLRPLDLVPLGGLPSQLVAGHTIVRQTASGAVDFQWSAWDHFTLEDWVARPPNLSQFPSIDFDHPNSIEVDGAGNYIVSFASLMQVVKIDPATGAMRWRFGGRENQFTLVGDELAGFGIQHDVRLLPNGDLLLFDNGNYHVPPESRAVEYRLDTLAMTATQVWEYRHVPAVFAPYVGSVQRYRNGHTLVGFGAAGVMTDVTGDGTVAWEGQLAVNGQSPAPFYRVRELPSLYTHESP